MNEKMDIKLNEERINQGTEILTEDILGFPVNRLKLSGGIQNALTRAGIHILEQIIP